MTATHMITPAGPMPIRQHVINQMATMTDREIADMAFESNHIDPEYYSELVHRGLSGPGMFKHDTYALIERRENEANK